MLACMSTRRRFALFSVVLVTLTAGGAVAALRPQWTSLPRAELSQWTKRFAKATRAHSDVAPVGSLLHIGHRAGSYEEYARTLEGDLSHVRRVVELMDMSFGPLGLNAIEIDVRSSPLEGDESAIVVHDRIAGELSAHAREYIGANTLRGLLRHYVRRGYHRQGKRLFVELKAPDAAGLDAEARAAIDRTVAALETTLRQHADAKLVRSHVEFISFNRHALKYARKALGAAAPLHRLHMILTTNQQAGAALAVIRGDLAVLDSTQTAWLADTSLLSGILFDPRYVDDFTSLFNGINRQRTERGLSPLALHLSTYSHDYPSFVARLAAEGKRLRHVRGLVYEVRRGN